VSPHPHPPSAGGPAPRWAISHDFAFDFGGAERVTALLASDVLPDAPVLLLGGDPEVIERMGIADRVRFMLPRSLVTAGSYRTTSLALSPRLTWRRAWPGPLLASSYAMAHWIRARGETVVYCHSPLRHAWAPDDYLASASGLTAVGFRAAVGPLRWADRRAAGRAGRYVATSHNVRDRIAGAYGRHDVPIVPPPTDTERFAPGAERRRAGRFLLAGRLVEPYKRVGLALDAFAARPDLELVVAGDGRDAAALRRRAPGNATFVGHVDEVELARLMRESTALLFPSRDDFGMVPVEAMATGTPVVAFRGGGAVDTVVDGVTGTFFDRPVVEDVVRALDVAAATTWDHDAIVAHAERFGAARFVDAMRTLLGLGPA